ncbi:MAG: DUF2155 domain-containing protein [Xanthobacteraceae bacterium]|nr:DUF2155 domain-containing protein [Xanthobacteraceae bacterium]
MAQSIFAQSTLRAVLVTGVVTFGASAALAQFGFIFGDPPPRPPGEVPGGNVGPGGRGGAPQPPRQYPPPPQQTPQNYPSPGGGAQTRPPLLDPNLPRGGAPPKGPPATATPAAPPPPDDEIIGPPTKRIVHPTAQFSGLDKITGRIINFPVDVGETVQFGALQLTTRACYTRPAEEAANTDAFVEVDEVTLQGEVKRIFTGWMFASSPGLHAVEHPIYDLWLTDCKGGSQVVPAGGTPEPPAAQPQPKAQPKQKQIQQQPKRPPPQQMPPPPGPPPSFR